MAKPFGKPRDMSRFVRWPTYIQIQRKKAILQKRLKVPPALNQFRCAANRNEATQLFKLLDKYRPETRQAKQKRLEEEAKAREGGAPPSKVKTTKYLVSGLDEVTSAVENKQAKLVVIAHDVDPIELVCWLPALCRKAGVPYCIVKGRARLGTLVGMKKCTAVALANVKKEDQATLEQLVNNFAPEFIDNQEVRKRWGN